MRRLSVPIDAKLLDDFNRAVPWGARQHLIRGLIKMALLQGRNILELAYDEGEGFEIKRKEPTDASTDGLEGKQVLDGVGTKG